MAQTNTRIRYALAAPLAFFAFSTAQAQFHSNRQSGPADGVTKNADFSDHYSDLPLLQIINSAHVSIDIEIYTMTDPAVIAALRTAMSKGVRVRVIQDATPAGGTSCDVFGAENAPPSSADPTGKPSAACKDLRKFVSQVKSSPGGVYTPYNKTNLCGGPAGTNCYQHGKMVIVDESAVLISTGNFNSSNLCDLAEDPSVCNRDYSYVQRDPAVVDMLHQIFEKDIKGARYDIAALMRSGGSAVNNKLTVSPLSRKPIFDLLKSAKKSIYIQNQYLKDPATNDLLEELASKGIDVHVNVASLCAFAKPKPADARNLTTLYTAWDDQGIVTRMFSKSVMVSSKPGYLHAKAVVVDGSSAWVGSVNGSVSAYDYNREFGMFTEVSAEVRALQSWIMEDMSDRGSETWQQSLDCDKD